MTAADPAPVIEITGLVKTFGSGCCARTRATSPSGPTSPAVRRSTSWAGCALAAAIFAAGQTAFRRRDIG